MFFSQSLHHSRYHTVFIIMFMNVCPPLDFELLKCSNHVLVIFASSKFIARSAYVRYPEACLLDRWTDKMERNWIRNIGWGLFLKYSRVNFFFIEKQQGKMMCKYVKKCLSEEKDFPEREVLRHSIKNFMFILFGTVNLATL